MKKLLFLLFIIGSFVLNAQNSKIEISNFSFESDKWLATSICENYVELTVHFSDKTTSVFFKENFGKGFQTSPAPDFVYNFPGKNIIEVTFKQLSHTTYFTIPSRDCDYYPEYYSAYNEENILITNKDNCSLLTYTKLKNAPYNFSPKFYIYSTKNTLKFDYKISNSVDVLNDPIKTQLGYDDPITINATPYLDSSFYNWQYQVVSGPSIQPTSNLWTDVPRPTTPAALEFTANGILPNSSIGKYIYFRIKPCNDDFRGKIVGYDILPSAPKIINYVTTPVTCYGANNGTVTLQFNKNLGDKESLAIEVVDLSKQINDITSSEPLYEAVIPGFSITSKDIINNKLTITGLRGSNPENFRIQFLGGSGIFADGAKHTIDFKIYEPDFVTSKITRFAEVYCKDGADGTITIEADGGSETGYQFSIVNDDGSDGTWIPFTNGKSHTITDLPANTYSIKVRDGNECVAKELVPDADGNDTPDQDKDLILEQLIEEPTSVLALEFLAVTTDRTAMSNDAKAFGFTDGRITAVVTGGTAPYTVEWKNKNTGDVVATVSSTPFDNVEESQTFTLNTIGEGTYTLTVTDFNHAQATQKATCFDKGDFSITQPDKLLLTLEETNPVSCNSFNEFNNPVGDGELVAHGTGGVQLNMLENNGLPYYYTWKKEDKNGVFQELLEEKDSILSNATAARYSVNIRDANGIVIGNYVNNSLDTETDVVHDLLDPEPLVITFTKGDLKCSDGTEGWAEANINGGTGNYTLKWSNGATDPKIENLEKGSYLLFVTDEKGCQATSQVRIEAPNVLDIAILEQKAPVCNNGADGIISLGISGGLEEYTYSWLKEGTPITNHSGFYANNLTAGDYTIIVTDANLCSKTVEINLANPSLDLINLGEDRLLCGGQSIVLDATYHSEGTTYVWTSDTGFTSTSSTIEVTEAGTYTVALTTLLGCNGGDSITISTTDTPIDAHFIVSTQAFAGEELALVNISEPLGDTVEWFFPPEAQIIAETKENVILLFDAPGAYDIILRTNQGTCFLEYMKTIRIGEAADIPDIGDAETPFIQDFKIFPNPSNGDFSVSINLTEASPISLKIFNMASQGLVHERQEKAAASFELAYGVTLASGTYVLLLETAKGSEIRKIIIK
ncbi:T9SS type A sorting domain-containing protein [Cellulophaga sp. HaHa_2_95]|uniref:T9SS type A sorting domain-containing protein n=1 Tax=Cellulophaga sp. HaHa_2_95 TaxID=2745558 RepID=UPI001C4E4BEB|nr:T9SS type A sorting domain-containing protein [Cellulophaga sp. HaHa_2_95]QXP55174.1 T9SS type A sorting domain-containing protein [Cellulophaga sp. HaHa_2_95]